MKIEALELINVLDALLTSDFPSQLITLIPLTYDLQKFKTLKNTFEILALDDKASVVEWYLEKKCKCTAAYTVFFKFIGCWSV